MRYYVVILQQLTMNSFKLFLLLEFNFVLTVLSSAQTDTIVVYDQTTDETSFISPITYNENTEFDSTPSVIGTYENSTTLPGFIPTENLYFNSEFTHLEPATNFFDLTTYPIRTAIRLFRIENDSLKGCCSGLMISENILLTAAHCVYSIEYEKTAEGTRNKIRTWNKIHISPAYNNGENQNLLPQSDVEKIFIPIDYYRTAFYKSDIALIKLKNNIGHQIGYAGIAFSKDDDFYEDNIFYKLSYPGTSNPDDSTEIYNGDKLYFNYGNITNDFNGSFLVTRHVTGIPGQSGSSLFFANEEQYYSVGVMIYSNSCRHTKINNKLFYTLKNILDKQAAGNTEVYENSTKVYPNPFSEFGIIEFNNPDKSSYSFEIFNSSGIKIFEEKGVTTNSIRITGEKFQTGLYFFRIKTKDGKFTKGRFTVI